MKQQIKISLTSVVAFAALSASGSVLPFAEDFEGGAVSFEHPWIVETSVQVIEGASADDSRYLQVSDDGLFGIVVDRAGGVVFADRLVRPVSVAELPDNRAPGAGPVVVLADAGDGARFFVLDGASEEAASWHPVGSAVDLDANGRASEWVRLTTRLDRDARSWDLFIDGELVAADVALLENGSEESITLPFGGVPVAASLFIDRISVGEENPLFPDEDSDGIPDAVEISSGTDPNSNDRAEDPDGDGLSNLSEWRAGTQADDPDTDRDGLADGSEIDRGLNPLTADTNGDGFLDSEGVPGFVRWEGWYGLPAKGMFTLTENLSFPDSPESVELVESFSLEKGGGRTEMYGNRLRALFVPPVSGDYRFWVAGHNEVSLLMSPDDNPLKAERIAYTPKATGPDRWFISPGQESESVRLNSEQEYYLELRHRNHRWGDFFSVAVEGPDADLPARIDIDDLFSFRRHASDWNDNLLPDDWERTTGLAALDEVAAYRGDPDGDGIFNFEELELGTNPLELDKDIPGRVIRRFWADLPVFSPHVLTLAPGYPATPYGHDLLETTETPIDWGRNYGARIEGYIIPPESGTYNLFVAGRLKSQLWLSSDESKFNRRLIASSDDTHQRDWSRYVSQNSGDIELEAGQRYYFEIRYVGYPYKGDHAALGWRRPGSTVVEIPGGENIGFVTVHPDDQDGDDLPDEWEVEHGFSAESAAGDDGYHGDPDGDGLPNFFEWRGNTSPVITDTDEDGLDDRAEHLLLTDGIDPASPGLVPLPDEWTLAVVGYSEHAEALGLANSGGFGLVSRNPGFVRTDVTYLEEGRWREFHNDNLAFLNTPVEGDFELVARLNMNAAQDPRFLGGLVFRESDAEKAGSFGIFSSPDQRFEIVQRASGSRKRTRRPAYTPADYGQVWLKLVRKGDAFYAYTSGDGTAWQPFGHATLPLAREGRIGFANAGVLDFGQVFGCVYRDFALRIDTDSDGLFDSEELEAGTDPAVADSDGDGVSDFLEKYEYLSNPSLADVVAGSPVPAPSPAEYSTVTGEMVRDAEVVAFKTGRGILGYEVNLPEDGLYRLKLAVGVLRNGTPDTDFGVRVSVDGQPVKRLEFVLPEVGSTGEGVVVLPWLRAGSHDLRLFFDNASIKRALRLDAFALERLGGPDADGDGQADWITNRLAVLNGFDAPRFTSHVSPFGLEGRSRFRTMLSSDASGEVRSAPAERWYQNVPLSAEESTEVSVSFENGGLVGTAEVAWTPLDLFAEDLDVQSVRVGDSIRFGIGLADGEAVRNLRYRVFDADEKPLGPPSTHNEQTDFIHRFDAPGVYYVSASAVIDPGPGAGRRAETREGVVAVDVVETSFAESPIVLWGEERQWVNSDLSGTALTELHIESDSRMFFGNAWQTEEGGHEFTLRMDALEPRYVLARLGGPDGPIVDSREIRPLKIEHNRDAALRYIDETEGGDLVVEMWMVVNEVYPEAEIDVDVLVGGVTLFDGSDRRRHYAEDFDELGVTKVLFIKSPSVAWNACHRLRYFQDGISLFRGK